MESHSTGGAAGAGAPLAGTGGASSAALLCDGAPEPPPATPWPAPIEVLAASQGMLTAVAVDASWVYFSNLDGAKGEVRRVSKSGGAVDVLLTGGINLTDLLVDEDALYVNDQAFVGGLKKISKTPGGPSKLLTVQVPFRLTQDKNFLYWSDLNHNTIRKASKSLGTIETLATESGGAVQSVSVYGEWVYWARYPEGRISRVHRNGGKVTLVAGDFAKARGVAADCHGVYWSPLGEVWWLPTGEMVPSRVGECIFCGEGLVLLDPRHVYLVGWDRITRIPRLGGPAESIAKHPSMAVSMGGAALDETHLYWVRPESGEVVRTRK